MGLGGGHATPWSEHPDGRSFFHSCRSGTVIMMVLISSKFFNNHSPAAVAGELIFDGSLEFPAYAPIVVQTDVGVDVFSNNTSHLAVVVLNNAGTSRRAARTARYARTTERRAVLCATTSTPSISTQTIE
jgi:hypothetical protein